MGAPSPDHLAAPIRRSLELRGFGLCLSLAVALPAIAAGCILSPLSLEDRRCPCGAGWRCDPARDRCVAVTGGPCTTRTDCRPSEACLDGWCVAVDAGPPCVPGTEICDGGDDDCDGRIDEGAGLCELASATSTCTSGRCAIARCHDGFADCDGQATTGCETTLGTTSDCGACEDACTGATRFCAPGTGGALACAASCPMTLTECSGSCVDLDVDRHHCGACDDACAPEHAMGACRAGVCAIAACDPGWADCDDDTANGCEASLAGDTTCGSCMRDCTTTTAGTCMIGRCVGGACTVAPGGEGAVCRPAASLCDVAETCDAAGNCPPDRFAAAGVACRDSTCGGLDPRELCTGTSGTCPAPCGCAGEPCCTGAVACSTGSSCMDGTCEACTPVPIVLSGGFPMPATATAIARQVTTMASTIRFADGTMSSGTITLPSGITATGSFSAACGTICDWLTSVVASGTTLTLSSAGAAGTPPMVTTITLMGATATGSAVAGPIAPTTLPGHFRSITTSGDTITFTDQALATSTIRLTRTGGACP